MAGTLINSTTKKPLIYDPTSIAEGDQPAWDSATSTWKKLRASTAYEECRQVGVSRYERWYAGGIVVAGNWVDVACGAGVLFAIPLDGPAGTVDLMSVKITQAASANKSCRLGIYRSLSDTDLHPGARVVDAGTVLIDSTGVKSIGSLTAALTPGRRHYLALLVETDPGTPWFLGAPVGSCAPVFGNGSEWTTGSTYDASAIYSTDVSWGALPDPFPTSGLGFAFNIPLIRVRYSA